MTLIEAIAALVIVGLSAVGWIGLAQGTTRTTRDIAQWEMMVSVAESTMEAALLARQDEAQGRSLPESVDGASASEALRALGVRATVTARAWGPGLSEVVVTVIAADGTPFTLHRIVPEGQP